MTPELAKYILPYVQAIAEGKTVQVKVDFGWIDIIGAYKFSPEENYRIKPEKIVEWLNVYPDGFCYNYATKEVADDAAVGGRRKACIPIEYYEGDGL